MEPPLKQHHQEEDFLEEHQQAHQLHLEGYLDQNQLDLDFLEELSLHLQHQEEVYLEQNPQLEEAYLELLSLNLQEEVFLEQILLNRHQASLDKPQLLEVYLELKRNLQEVYSDKAKLNNFNKFQLCNTSTSLIKTHMASELSNNQKKTKRSSKFSITLKTP